MKNIILLIITLSIFACQNRPKRDTATDQSNKAVMTNAPTSVLDSLAALGRSYIEVGYYNSALALTDEMLEHIGDDKQKRATVYYNKALIYVYMNDDANALEYTMKSLAILDKLQLQEEQAYKDCLDLIPAIEEIAEGKKKN